MGLKQGKTVRSLILLRSAISKIHIVLPLAAAATASLAGSSMRLAQAANLLWDANAAGVGQTDGAGTWLTASQWWNGASNVTWNSGTPDNAIIGNSGTGGIITGAAGITAGSASFGPFSGTYTLNTGTLALNGTAGYVPSTFIAGQSGSNLGTVGLYVGTTAGTVTLGSTAVTVANAQSWYNESANLVTLNSAATLTGALNLKSGKFVFFGANTGAGGVTVDGATFQVGNNAAAGTGTLTLTSGTISSNAAGTARTLTNNLTINGSVTFGDPTNNGALTFQGVTQQLTSSNPTLTFNSGANTTTFNTNTFNLSSNNMTLAATSAASFNAGLTWTGARTITTSGSGNLKFQGAMAGSSTPSLTFTGTGSNIFFGDTIAVTGTTGGVTVNGPTVTFGVGTSTYTGGVTATSGITRFGADSTVVANAITQGPLGLGTFTANGGTITASGSTARIINNNLAITGDSTFGVIGDATNTGTLTFNPTGVTGGTITLSGARTETVNVATTMTGPIAGSSTPSLAVKGIGTLTLTNATATASTFGNVAIGDSVPSGSLGGNVSVSSQNAMGSGAYTINYGGRLTYANAIASNNVINVNNGGTLSLNGTPVTSLITFASGSTLATGGNVTLTQGTTVSLPTAGALFNNAGNIVTVTGAYPAFAGTTAFGGTGSGNITTGAVTTTSGAQTLAFNQTGGGSVYLNGLTLGGDLTVAGTGNPGMTGIIPTNSTSLTGVLGTVGESVSSSVSVNLAPIGVAQINNLSSFSGGLTLNSGILAVNRPGSSANTTTKAFTNISVIALNGGTFRATNESNNTQTMADNFSVGTNGGTLETLQTNNGPRDHTFNGAITGSGALTLRYGGTGTNSSSLVLAPTSASVYSGTITLATTNGRGRAQFNANSLAGLSVGAITVTQGTTFGVDAYSTLTTNIGKFTTNSESILALDNISGGNVDLSAATGINRDIRVGGVAVTVSGAATLTPFGNTFKLSPQGNFGVNTTNWLTGNNNLDVRAGAISPGAYNVAASANVFFNNSQNYTGSTTVSGIVNNSLMGGTTTAPTLAVSGGDLSYVGATTVAKGGKITITTLTGKLSGTSGLTISGGGSIQDGDGTAANNNGVTNRINSAATLTLGAAGEGGGTFTTGIAAATFTHAQTLASLTVNLGENGLSTTGSGGTGTLTFSGPAASVYTRTAGSTVNIATTAGFTTNFTNVPTTNISGTGADAILVGAFLNNAGFASATNVVGNPAYTVQNSATSWNTLAGKNIDTSAAITGTTATGAVSINSLRAVNGGTVTIGTAATDSLTIASGMLIFGANGLAINGPGTLTTGNGQDLVINMSGNNPSIGAKITGAMPLTITNGGGNGNLTLSNAANDYTGLNIFGNRVLITSAGAWGNPGPINISGTNSVLSSQGSSGSNFSKTLSSGYSITSLANGGGTFANTGTGTLTIQGTVTLNGSLTVGGLSNGTVTGDGTMDFQGNISGAAQLGVGYGNHTRILLSGADNSGWTGGLQVSSTAGTGSGSPNIFAFNSNSLGSNAINASPIAINRTANFYFDTNAAGAVTMNQAIAYNANATISFWGKGSGLSTVGGTAPLTWAGQILGSAGVTLQGNATASNQVSEIVLKNTVSTSGTPLVYSYGTATSSQNFVNGQGGIQLGVTGFRGITATTATDRVETEGGGSASAVLNGALGFVRFDGANSFIPGAVGPGYLSAIHLGGDAATYGNGTLAAATNGSTGGANALYGYLLTGGSTYTLPEGKSFVVGSLGTGTQIGGTLGSTGTGINTATLVGSPKLSGFDAGDLNIHANAVGDTQSLNLLARASTDTLKIGTSTTGVVFAPTYGDSGITNSVTLMSTRTGATTINKIGAGTVEIVNAHYNNIAGATDSAKAGITLNVNAGTLRYSQVDTGTSYAGVNVNSGGTLAGNGTIKGAVSVANGGTLAPDSTSAIGILSTGNLALVSGSTYQVNLTGTGTVAGTNNDQAVVNGAVSLGNSTLTLVTSGLTLSGGQFFTIINNDGTLDAVSGTFNGLAEGSLVTNFGGTNLYVTYTGESNALGSGNDVGLYTTGVPEPTSLSALGLGAIGLLRRRRRCNRA